jgi:hypothetical protein
VIPNDPNIQRVELVASALGELRDQLVLVGGCAVSLLIDSATAPPPRVTYDVDLIAEVAALRDYHALEKAFAQRGFTRDMSPEAPICRWTVGSVRVDLMPTAILPDEGFRNTLPGLIAPDELHPQRVTTVLARLSEVAAL